MAPRPIPDGYHTVTLYLVARGLPRLLDFLTRAFNASIGEQAQRPDGTIMHVEARIGDSVVMMSEASDEFPPMPAMIHMYVPDVDAVYQRALDAGGTSLRGVADQFYGDRSGGVKDPTGNQWWISTHVEDVSREEMRRRMAAQMKEPAATR